MSAITSNGGSGDGLRREMSFPARHDASANLRRLTYFFLIGLPDQ